MFQRSDCWYEKSCGIKNEDCIAHCIRFEEMKFLMTSSGIPKSRQLPIQLTATCEEDLQSFKRLATIKTNIVKFVNDGKCLFIGSKYTGNGKTSWAIKLMLKYFDEVWAGNGFKVRGMFVHVPTLLLQLKDFNNPLSKEYRDNLMNCDMVIFDDICATGMSPYDFTQLLSYIDQRILNNKTNIYTSNALTEELRKTVGDKLASRIGSAENIIFIGKDERYGSSNTNIK